MQKRPKSNISRKFLTKRSNVYAHRKSVVKHHPYLKAQSRFIEIDVSSKDAPTIDPDPINFEEE